MASIGKLISVPLREVWANEAYGFSAWLAENIGLLSEAIGIQLTVQEREKAVGSFWVDIVAEDDSGSRTIIENQLEQTDHEHLGKILTYLTNLDAKTAIWVTSQQRPEHTRAIQWLNEATPEDISF